MNGEEIHVDRVIRITTPKAEEWIQKFDEHTVDMCHKFGIIYQTTGQVGTLYHTHRHGGSYVTDHLRSTLLA